MGNIFSTLTVASDERFPGQYYVSLRLGCDLLLKFESNAQSDHQQYATYSPVCIHMNGRVYDPGVGRMISSDPVLPDLLNSQAFNRFAYVYNNPLNAIDPSGYDGESDLPGDSNNDTGYGFDSDVGCGRDGEPACDIGTVSAHASRCMSVGCVPLAVLLMPITAGDPFTNEGRGGSDSHDQKKQQQKQPQQPKPPSPKCGLGAGSASGAGSALNGTASTSGAQAAANTAATAGTAADVAAPSADLVAAGAVAGGAANPDATILMGSLAKSGLESAGVVGATASVGQAVYEASQGDINQAAADGADATVAAVVTDLGIGGVPETAGLSLVASGGILGVYTYFGGIKGITQGVKSAAQSLQSSLQSGGCRGQ